MALECPLGWNHAPLWNQGSLHAVDPPILELANNFHAEWSCWWRCFCKCAGHIIAKGDQAFKCSNSPQPEESLCWVFNARSMSCGKGDSSSASFASIACASCLFDLFEAVWVDLVQVRPNPWQACDCVAVDWSRNRCGAPGAGTLPSRCTRFEFYRDRPWSFWCLSLFPCMSYSTIVLVWDFSRGLSPLYRYLVPVG